MAYGVGEFDLPFVTKLFAPVAVLWHAPMPTASEQPSESSDKSAAGQFGKRDAIMPSAFAGFQAKLAGQSNLPFIFGKR